MASKKRSSRPKRVRTSTARPAHQAAAPDAVLFDLLLQVKSRRTQFLIQHHGLDDLQRWLDGVAGLHQILARIASVFQDCNAQVDAQLGELLALTIALPRLRKSPAEIRRKGTRLIRQLLGQMPTYRRQAATALATAHRRDFWEQFTTTFDKTKRRAPRRPSRQKPHQARH